MKITDFINGKVEYDKFNGQYFWIKTPTGGLQTLAEMRGYGAISKMFKTTKETDDFQDEVGKFIADAINEKIERDFKIKL